MPEDAKLDRVDYVFIAFYIALAIAALVYVAYTYGQALQLFVQYCQQFTCK